LRDLTPGNLMIDGEQLSMIDPEFFARAGELVSPAFTFGYALLSTIRVTGIAPAGGDEYNLGMCIAYLTTGVEPPIITESTSDDLANQVLVEWLDLLTNKYSLAAFHEPSIRRFLGLPLREPEGTRLSLDRRAASADDDAANEGAIRMVRSVLEDSIENLIEVDWEETRHNGETPWRVDNSGTTTGDHASVQTGFGEVIQILADLTTTPSATKEAEQCLSNSVQWLIRALPWKQGRTLPGLYFGRSGTAWALASASQALGDPGIRKVARQLLISAPIQWNNPDMTHGLSGLGTAHLAVLRQTGDSVLEKRAKILADRVLQRADLVNGEMVWPIRQTQPNIDSDQTHLGFGHRVAGMGQFLLDAADYFGDTQYLEMASAAFRTLKGRAVHRPSGAINWPIGVLEGADNESLVRWWCSGSGGIGEFMVRYGAISGDLEAKALARGAARACAEEDMSLMPGHCHGISGNAQLFLDMAEFDTPGAFRNESIHSARTLANHRIADDGRFVFGNDSGNRMSVSYGQGVTGPMAFLMRLLYRTPRPFTWNPSPKGSFR